MTGNEAVWERFLKSRFTSDRQRASQLQTGVLDGRSTNLTADSIALHGDEDTAMLMRELAVRSTTELLSEKASRELARRNRYVDYVRAVLSCAAADCSGRGKKMDIALRCIKVSWYFHSRAVPHVGSLERCIAPQARRSMASMFRSIQPSSYAARLRSRTCRFSSSRSGDTGSGVLDQNVSG